MSDSVSQSVGGIADLKKARRQKAASADVLRTDRQPPNSPEAEQGVLGCAMILPNECLAQCADKLRAGSVVFYDLRHQVIYAAMMEMHEQREKVDTITLMQNLKDKKLLEQIGGVAYLNALQDMTPSAANIGYYADVVQEKHLLRKMIIACTSAIAKVYDYEGDVDRLLDEMEVDMLAIRERKKSVRANIRELVHQSIELIERKYANKGALHGLSTGFTDLDKYTDGLCPADLIVPCAFPSDGKTSLLMNIIEHIVLVEKRPAAVFSFEMTAEQLVTRFLCSNARVNLRRVGEGWMAESDFPKLTSAAGRTSNAKLYIVDDVSTMRELRGEARRLHQEFGIEAMGADYLQRIQPEAVKGASREQEVSGVSSGLKSLAKELRIPIICPSQLNDDGKLRESRAIGQDADGIWRLEPQEDGKTEESQLVNLWIRKNRNGPRDVCVRLLFQKHFTRFESVSQISDEEFPRE